MVSENITTALIVEDDFLFKENHNLIFSDLIDNVPSDYSCCFFSECCGNTLHCFGNSKYEEKYNKFVTSYGTADDEEIIKYIDNMLVKLWRQMAQRAEII